MIRVIVSCSKNYIMMAMTLLLLFSTIYVRVVSDDIVMKVITNPYPNPNPNPNPNLLW
jgi:hypothetical protein